MAALLSLCECLRVFHAFVSSVLSSLSSVSALGYSTEVPVLPPLPVVAPASCFAASLSVCFSVPLCDVVCVCVLCVDVQAEWRQCAVPPPVNGNSELCALCVMFSWFSCYLFLVFFPPPPFCQSA